MIKFAIEIIENHSQQEKYTFLYMNNDLLWLSGWAIAAIALADFVRICKSISLSSNVGSLGNECDPEKITKYYS